MFAHRLHSGADRVSAGCEDVRAMNREVPFHIRDLQIFAMHETKPDRFESELIDSTDTNSESTYAV